jgi:hypothetical protein
MPRYRVVKRAYLRPTGSVTRLVVPGETIDFDGVPNSALVPVDEAARAAWSEWAQHCRPTGLSLAAEREARAARARASKEAMR